MKLRALELEQFRKFDRPIRIAGMDDGLNLVVGPNEMGKSTLFAALAGGSVRAPPLAGPDGQEPAAGRPRRRRRRASPCSSRSSGQPYRIEKRFLRRPSAELALPDGRHLHGEAAEEALEALLGGGSHGRRSAAEVLGICSLLWVGQGQSFVPARDRPGRARHAAVGSGRRDRRDPRRRSWRRADRSAWTKPCTSWSTARAAAGRYKEADDARQAARARDRATSKPGADGARADLRARERARRARAPARRPARAGMPSRSSPSWRRGATSSRCGTPSCARRRRRWPRLRHELAQVQAEQARRQAAARRRSLAAEHDARGGRAPPRPRWRAPPPQPSAWPANRRARWSACRPRSMPAENQQRGLQRLAQAIRQRDDGRAALRAAASEVRFELEPQALERVRVDGRPLDEAARSLRIVDPLDDRDRGRGPHPGPPRGRRSPAPAEQPQGRRAADRPRARGAWAAPAQARSPPAGVRARGRRRALGGNAAPPAPRGWRMPPCWPEAAAVETALAEAERQIDGLVAQLRAGARASWTSALDGAPSNSAPRTARRQSAATQARRRLEQLRAELSEAERSRARGRPRWPHRAAARAARAAPRPACASCTSRRRRSRSKIWSSALPSCARRRRATPPRCASAS